jgi:hypothetical protein
MENLSELHEESSYTIDSRVKSSITTLTILTTARHADSFLHIHTINEYWAPGRCWILFYVLGDINLIEKISRVPLQEIHIVAVYR